MSTKLNSIIDLAESNKDEEFHQEIKEMTGPTFDADFQYSCDESVSDNTIEHS